MEHDKRTYLDYNATVPLRIEAQSAMIDALQLFGNATSVHWEGRQARMIIEKAREYICKLVNARATGVIFTSGGTEACNTAMNIRKAPAGDLTHILVSDIEHPAVLRVAEAIGLEIISLPVTSDGLLDIDVLEEVLQKVPSALVAVMAVNNETGVIQPITEIGEKIRAYGGVFFCDAIQAAGKIPLDMVHMNIDLLSLSAHKLGGPTGIGALVVASDIVIRPLLYGGGQELNRRAGTENLIGIAGFGAIVDIVMENIKKGHDASKLRDMMEKRLLRQVPDMRIFGLDAPRISNTSFFSAPYLNSETLVIALDLAGISVSSGAACSSQKVTQSHVLTAMGVDEDFSSGALRVSFGWNSTEKDVEDFTEHWCRLVAQSTSHCRILQATR